MADTFVNIHLHIVFAVKYRDAMLDASWRGELFKYIGGIIKTAGHMPIMIGGHVDHVHILMSANKHLDLPKLIKDIKLATNLWIQPKYKCKFQWQSGYGCFAISCTHVPQTIDYIENQEVHHSKISMLSEFRRLFEINGGNYKENSFFKDPE